MNKPDIKLEILTLGRFSISVQGKPVATEWPDETIKVLFCSLLSPLDLYITWDRLCRSLCALSATRPSRHRLETVFIRPLNSFLLKELGFTPLITGPEGLGIDKQRIHLDALEFQRTAVEGLALLSLDNQLAALEKLNRAKSLYKGCYLPGVNGKIIDSTRKDLESLYQTVVMAPCRSHGIRSVRDLLDGQGPDFN